MYLQIASIRCVINVPDLCASYASSIHTRTHTHTPNARSKLHLCSGRMKRKHLQARMYHHYALSTMPKLIWIYDKLIYNRNCLFMRARFDHHLKCEREYREIHFFIVFFNQTAFRTQQQYSHQLPAHVTCMFTSISVSFYIRKQSLAATREKSRHLRK